MRWWVFAVLSAVLAAPAAAADAEPLVFDWGPIASRRVDVNGDLRLKVLGPLFERAVSTNGLRFRAARPVYGSVFDPAEEKGVRDILWPVGYSLRFHQDHRWRFLLAYYQNFGLMPGGETRYRFWVLPVYFQGRDAKGESYLAVFPLGGRLNEFIGRDRISFVLFPLAIHSSVNEVETQDYLWPFISHSEGKGIYRYRVLPFYGRAIHRDRWEKRFILWPFWTWAHYKYPRSSGKGYILFPLWGHFDLQDQESWLFLPPFIRFSRGQRLNYTYCPWPFFQKSSGEIEKLYLFPLWGRKIMKGMRSSFVLWPIFRKQRIDRGPVVVRRHIAMPFFYAEARVSRANPGEERRTVGRFVKVWPVLLYQRDGDARYLRLLELWPFRNIGPVERCYAPFWTLYARSAVGDAVDTEVLWGLYRSSRRGTSRSRQVFPIVEWSRDDAGEGRREWAVLKGLVGYRREGTQRTLRVLYWPLRFGTRTP